MRWNILWLVVVASACNVPAGSNFAGRYSGSTTVPLDDGGTAQRVFEATVVQGDQDDRAVLAGLQLGDTAFPNVQLQTNDGTTATLSSKDVCSDGQDALNVSGQAQREAQRLLVNGSVTLSSWDSTYCRDLLTLPFSFTLTLEK